ncbi:MAG: T9SS type A sorting domain-containing protein [Chitinophagales bacterium]|nr:T9SS type A sorting domain-containing protein [Chitinophagales bacterium]
MILKACQVCIFALYFSTALYAQNYPLDIGFYNVLSGQLPTGWSGDMTVMLYHGMNDDKGLAGLIGSGDKEDSVVTDWIGPLDDYIEIVFWYRMVDDFIYPSTEKYLTTDRLTLSLTEDGTSYHEVYVIDSSNHLPSLNFRRINFNLSGMQGKTIKLKFLARHGKGGNYYVDIDSIKVRKDTPPPFSVQNITESGGLTFYPSPVKSGEKLYIKFHHPVSTSPVYLYNPMGALVYENRTEGDEADLAVNLPAGIYFLQVGHARKKILIQ